MARWVLPEMSPWRRRAADDSAGLVCTPGSGSRCGNSAWACSSPPPWSSASQLIVSAPHSIVTVFDFTNCYAAPPVVLPCERVAYRAGAMNAAFNAWCGLLLMAVAAWLALGVVERGRAQADHRRLPEAARRLVRARLAQPRTWPWTRMGWAYGFTLVGAAATLAVALFLSAEISSSEYAKAPLPHVETSQRFREVH